MTVTSGDVSSPFIVEVTSKLRENPVYQVLLIHSLILVLVLLFDDQFVHPIFYLTVVFGSLIPAIYAERTWDKLKEQDMMKNHYRKFKYIRFEFLMTGVLFSIYFSAIVQIHNFLIGNQLVAGLIQSRSREISVGLGYSPNVLSILMYLLVFAITLIMVSYKLAQIGTDLQNSSKHNRYFNHPLILQSAMAYFVAGSYASIVILFPFQVGNFSSNFLNGGFVNPGLSSGSFVQYNFQSFGLGLPLMMILPMFFMLAMSIHQLFIPYVLDGKLIIIRDREHLKRWGMYLGVLIVVASWVIFDTNRTEGLSRASIVLTVFVLVAIWASIRLIREGSEVRDTCHDCGFAGGTDCIYCENIETENHANSRFSLFSKTKVPSCPNCGQNWDNLSRRCSNCQYTIVLTCDNCSQTINPLWRKCNLCGEPRQPVPDIALSLQESNDYAYSRARYLLILLLTLPFVIIQLIYLNEIYSAIIELEIDQNTNTNLELILYDDVKRLLLWLLLLIMTLLLIYRTSNRVQHTKLMVTDEFIRLLVSELILIFVIQLTVAMFIFPFVEGEFLFLTLIAIVVLIAITVGIGYYRYRNLKNHSPPIMRMRETQLF